jgi:hypothetical protein
MVRLTHRSASVLWAAPIRAPEVTASVIFAEEIHAKSVVADTIYARHIKRKYARQEDTQHELPAVAVATLVVPVP